eukprot:3979148-Prymnesium_polylepis.1
MEATHHPGATAVVVREGAWHRSQWLGKPAADVARVLRVVDVVDVVERCVEAPHLERELPPHPLRVA